MDANAAGLRARSTQAAREGLRNLVYVRSAVEALPEALAGVADEVTVVFPWGSLLAAVARPSVPVLRAIRSLCRPNGRLTVVLGVDAERDRAELQRLGVPPNVLAGGASRLVEAYEDAGLAVSAMEPLGRADLAGWPTTWARRLSHGQGRSVVRIDATATGREAPPR